MYVHNIDVGTYSYSIRTIYLVFFKEYVVHFIDCINYIIRYFSCQATKHKMFYQILREKTSILFR